MLVLSRKSNQSIVIGGDVVVTVLEIKGDQGRIGIRAPRSVTVHREEVHREIVEQNRAAAASTTRPSVDELPRPGSAG